MKIIPLYFIVTLMLLGCSTKSKVDQSMESTDRLEKTASGLVSELRHKQPKSVVAFHQGQWVQTTPILLPEDKQSPMLTCDFTYSISPQNFVSIFEIGQAITSACSIPVRITPDAISMLNGLLKKTSTSDERENTVSASPGIRLNGMPVHYQPSTYSNKTEKNQHLINELNWDGPVSGFLDMVTTRLGLSWKYANNIISIYFTDTKRFYIKTLNAKGTTKSVITSGVSSKSGSNANKNSDSKISGENVSSQSSSLEITSDLYGDIRKVVESMLTPEIGRAELSSTTGILSVTDTPEALQNIQAYINEENQSLSQQVLLNVKIISVEISEKNEFGIDWNLIYQSLQKNYNISLKNAFASSPEATSGSISILGNPTHQFSGSQALINALSEQGKVGSIKTKSIITTNMVPAPIQYAFQEGFLESQTITNTGDTTSNSLNPGYLTTGDNITLLPKINPGTKNLMLDLIMSISSSKGFRKIKSKENTGNIIELPTTEGQALYQRVRLTSGETLVLSGFEQEDSGGRKVGLGNSSNFLFGGGLSGKNTRNTLVITVNPVIL
ncbi:MAG: PilN family type IVB pilus formation outer membrane protein (plasmid) [Candidatus Symbiodolus clandestinus]